MLIDDEIAEIYKEIELLKKKKELENLKSGKTDKNDLGKLMKSLNQLGAGFFIILVVVGGIIFRIRALSWVMSNTG